jgi:shikimate dehydrogenase
VADVLELGAEGWLRQGEPWQPSGPFYAVLGDPVSHSLSPAMHSAALREREIDAEYLPVRLDTGRLRQLKESPASRLLAGFNVTAPHKETVAALCDGRTDQARDTGAVNTVKVEEGRWLGHNTDSGGIRTVLAQAWTAKEPPVRAVVLGAGGSARAAVDALVQWEVPRVEVRNRSAAGRGRIGRWLEARGWMNRVSVEPLSDGQEGIPDTPMVWISCLAAGVDTRPFLPVAAGPAPALLLDLRYGDQLPADDPPLGFRFCDGLPVLLMQGGLAFTWWFGPPVPWPVMRDALMLP